MNKAKELDPEQFRKMQLIELEVLSEFDRVCRKNNINYAIFFGTLLGAVRHKGYIPWDDDTDVVMLREDYERFKKHMNELNPEICCFQDHDTEPEYRWGYGKLRRSGTIYIRVGQEHMKFRTGIFVDVFPLDDVPLSVCGQMLQDFHCFCLRKILWSEAARKNTSGLWKLWFSLLSLIPISIPFRALNRYISKSTNSSPNKVRCLTFPSPGKLYMKHPARLRYGVPKSWITERAEYEFEGRKFYGPKDYDEVLSYIYGDYMTPPPEDKREKHSPFSKIKFPGENIIE